MTKGGRGKVANCAAETFYAQTHDHNVPLLVKLSCMCMTINFGGCRSAASQLLAFLKHLEGISSLGDKIDDKICSSYQNDRPRLEIQYGRCQLEDYSFICPKFNESTCRLEAIKVVNLDDTKLKFARTIPLI
jgi:hypothetical protein